MTAKWDKVPTTDSQLFDKLATLFGYGSYDDLVCGDDLPYWKYRMKEIAKVASSRKKNDCSVVEAARIADYCKATGVVITGPHSLYRHQPQARRWWAEKLRAERDGALDDLIRDAIAQEAETDPDGIWLERLLRATGPYREEVYEQWQKDRTPP